MENDKEITCTLPLDMEELYLIIPEFIQVIAEKSGDALINDEPLVLAQLELILQDSIEKLQAFLPYIKQARQMHTGNAIAQYQEEEEKEIELASKVIC